MKSFFLGPQSENSQWFHLAIEAVLQRWFAWRKARFPKDGGAVSESDQNSAEYCERQKELERLTLDLLNRFEEELPKFSPRYIGHMFSEVSLPALVGHFIALLHNPNNISSESSRVGSVIETEAIDLLKQMIGFAHDSQGHFTGGGTVANFEMLVRARNRIYHNLAHSMAEDKKTVSNDLFHDCMRAWESLSRQSNPTFHSMYMKHHFLKTNRQEFESRLMETYNRRYLEPVLLVPAHAHYSWKKGADLIGLTDESVWQISLDRNARLCLSHLDDLYQKAKGDNRPVLAIVSVAGTTELGNIDNIADICEWVTTQEARDGVSIWHHVDAAYGGYFCSLLRSSAEQKDDLTRFFPSKTVRSLDAIGKVTSVTLDPHKLGYVPYSCGAFFCARKEDYQLSETSASYIDYSKSTDRGLHTLEGSRGAGGAVATWLCAKSIGLDAHGYGRILARTIEQKKKLEERLLVSHEKIRVLPETDTNILCFHVAKRHQSLLESNRKTLEIIKRLSSRENESFYVSKTSLLLLHNKIFLTDYLNTWDAICDDSSVLLVRLCLMNPFFSSRQLERDLFELLSEAIVTTIESLGSASP